MSFYIINTEDSEKIKYGLLEGEFIFCRRCKYFSEVESYCGLETTSKIIEDFFGDITTKNSGCIFGNKKNFNKKENKIIIFKED